VLPARPTDAARDALLSAAREAEAGGAAPRSGLSW